MRAMPRIADEFEPGESAPATTDFRRFTIAFLAFLLLPPLLVIGVVVVVDPYYLLGSPSWRGINVVRPFYEAHVLDVKPYQVRRLRPDAVNLGSSTAEVGIDPDHPGWGGHHTFNFGLPSATSYEVMLAFVHAQAVGRPLKQAVVGLDFFAYNIFKERDSKNAEGRFAGNGAAGFADFLAAELASRPRTKPEETPARSDTAIGRPNQPQPQAASEADGPWNETLYRRVHPDVAAAIKRGDFKSGREHYQLAGRAEGRKGGSIPSNWNEALYLKMYPDVAAEVARGTFLNGYHHYLVAGRAEGREGIVPSNWNEALYLKMYPDVAAEVARGTFLNGYHHYLAAGRKEGRQGFIPANWDEALYVKLHPDVAAEIKRGTFISGYHHYVLAGRAEKREGGFPPVNWDETGYLRMYPDVANEVRKGTFLSGYHHYLVAGRAEGRKTSMPPDNWDDALYLRLYADVRNEVKKGTFLNGYHHYLAAGKAEGRQSGVVPSDWDEATYLDVNRDVAYQVSLGTFLSGYHHFLVAGKVEGRLGGYNPSGWNEAQYLAANPEARLRIALGDYRSGYAHYAHVGRTRGLQGGFAPDNLLDRLGARWPRLSRWLFQFDERFQMIFSSTAVHDAVVTPFRQSEDPAFNDRGMRDWSESHDGGPFLDPLVSGAWQWLRSPRYQYCFTNQDSGMTAFDPYRYMLRRAYDEGTDLRLYVIPINAAVRAMIDDLGLGEHYQSWLRELVRINEEEAARAKREPLPLWDFSDPNEITREPVPPLKDLTRLKYFWEYSHFRKAAGNLVLDRVLGYTDPNRRLPADFGKRLTGATINAHLFRTQAGIAEWAAANRALADQLAAAAHNPKANNRQAQATCW